MAEQSKGQPFRNSTGKLKSVAEGVDDGPNYLRASSGSCHDFCKYGTPHEIKAKPKRPVRRRSTPNAEIAVEIFVPSDKRSTKAAKPSSVVPDPSKSTKLEVAVSGQSAKSIRQQAQTRLDVKSLSPDLSKSVNQGSSFDVERLSPDSSTSVKQQESSLDVKPSPHDSLISVKQESSSNSVKQESSSNSVKQGSSSNSVKQESSLDVISESLDSSKSVKKESSLDVKDSKITDKQESSSNSVKQESSLDGISELPDFSKSVKMDSSLDVKPSPHDSSISIKQESSSNSVKQESSLDVISELLDSSKSVKKDSSLDEKPSPPDSSISAKQKSSSVVKSSPPDSSISVKQESSSDVKSPSHPFLKKGSSSQRNSSSASKSTLQDLQSRRKSSLSNSSESANPARSPRLMPGSISRKSASKSVKQEVHSSNGKAPLKNSTEKSSSPNSLVRKSGSGSSGKRHTTVSKIENDLKKSKEASKKNVGSPTAPLSLKTRKNPKTTIENSLTSSTIALTPNLPGTKVSRLNVRKSITQKEATSEELNGNSSASKKPEKVPEITLHMIEVEKTQLPFSPGSVDSLCQSKSPFSSQDAVETNESESEYSESEAHESVSNYRGNRGKGKAEGNESGSVKLKFRKGKVVDLQSEIYSPKRLRFRRKKSLGKDQCQEDGVKVVLRHQDLQEKKSDKGLLNVVIEETASKLVETRKSRVKALVGAFETVISLQESKSAGEKLTPYSSPGR